MASFISDCPDKFSSIMNCIVIACILSDPPLIGETARLQFMPCVVQVTDINARLKMFSSTLQDTIGNLAMTYNLQLVYNLDVCCEAQQQSLWCWAACATTIQNFYGSLQSGDYATAQADVVALNFGSIKNEAAILEQFLTDKLNYPASKIFSGSTEQDLLLYLIAAIDQGWPMAYIDGGASHSLIVLGFGVPKSGTGDDVLVYFDPSYKIKNLTSGFAVAPFSFVLPYLTSKTDYLTTYGMTPGAAPYYMRPLLNQMTPDPGWQYPYWHVVGGKSSNIVDIPKSVYVNGFEYTCRDGTGTFYYYPRFTLGPNPLSTDAYYASYIEVDRKGHSYTARYDYGVMYDDPHEQVEIQKVVSIPQLGVQPNEFFVHLIPMYK